MAVHAQEGGDEEDDPTAEKDDLQVAWEALETAKVLYQRTADTSASELAGRCTVDAHVQ